MYALPYAGDTAAMKVSYADAPISANDIRFALIVVVCALLPLAFVSIPSVIPGLLLGAVLCHCAGPLGAQADRRLHRRRSGRDRADVRDRLPARRRGHYPIERDDASSNCHPVLSFCLSMISAQTLRVCREGKPVPTFPDHAVGHFSGSCIRLTFARLGAAADADRSPRSSGHRAGAGHPPACTISRFGVADGARRRSSVAMSRSKPGLRSQAMAKAAALERLIPAQQWISSAR